MRALSLSSLSLSLVAALSVGGACLAACTTADAAAVRAATYAPSFQYIERERLKDTMWRFADDVSALDAQVRDKPSDQVAQAEVLRLLDDMRDAASHITAPGQSTNHPMLDQNLASFLVEIARARDAAAAQPPSYFLAGSITGACLHCHSRQANR